MNSFSLGSLTKTEIAWAKRCESHCDNVANRRRDSQPPGRFGVDGLRDEMNGPVAPGGNKSARAGADQRVILATPPPVDRPAADRGLWLAAGGAGPKRQSDR